MVTKSRPSAGLAIASVLLLGTFTVAAAAEQHDDQHRGDDRGHERGWGGGYRAPPVAYGGPAYYPPPVVYGPAVGIAVPGIMIGIQ